MNAGELRQKDCFKENSVLIIIIFWAPVQTWSKEKLRLYQSKCIGKKFLRFKYNVSTKILL